MLRSLIYLLITSFYISFRKNVDVKQKQDNHVYEQTYDVPLIDAKYIVRVSETVFTINYNFWFIPSVKRCIYRADLTYKVNGVIKNVFTAYYPSLIKGNSVDPLYPLVVVSSTHLENFLTKEQNL